MTNVKHAFEEKVVQIPVERIIANGQLATGVLATSKYKTILSSIAELGVIEPLAVFRSIHRLGDYDLLDGRLRLEAIKELGREAAPCMISTDDEGFTFNRHITRTTAIQEHKMIRATLAKGNGTYLSPRSVPIFSGALASDVTRLFQPWIRLRSTFTHSWFDATGAIPNTGLCDQAEQETLVVRCRQPSGQPFSP